MVASPRHLDDHPLLTARHVDDLTAAVRTQSQLLTRTNELLQQIIRVLLQTRDPQPKEPSPTAPIARSGNVGIITSSRATPARRKSPR